MIPNTSNHPWGNFLNARVDAIQWMSEEMGYDDPTIAKKLSMDTMQVTLIRMQADDSEYHYKKNIQKK